VALKRAAGVQSVASGVEEVSGKSGDALTAEVVAVQAEKTNTVPAPEAGPRVTFGATDEAV
jgi:hypothetical protein